MPRVKTLRDVLDQVHSRYVDGWDEARCKELVAMRHKPSTALIKHRYLARVYPKGHETHKKDRRNRYLLQSWGAPPLTPPVIHEDEQKGFHILVALAWHGDLMDYVLEHSKKSATEIFSQLKPLLNRLLRHDAVIEKPDYAQFRYYRKGSHTLWGVVNLENLKLNEKDTSKKDRFREQVETLVKAVCDVRDHTGGDIPEAWQKDYDLRRLAH